MPTTGGKNEFQISDIQTTAAPLETVDAGGVGYGVSSDEEVAGVCFYFNVESDFVSTLTE